MVVNPGKKGALDNKGHRKRGTRKRGHRKERGNTVFGKGEKCLNNFFSIIKQT